MSKKSNYNKNYYAIYFYYIKLLFNVNVCKHMSSTTHFGKT